MFTYLVELQTQSIKLRMMNETLKTQTESSQCCPRQPWCHHSNQCIKTNPDNKRHQQNVRRYIIRQVQIQQAVKLFFQ